jgi:hypothetical protein
MSNISFAKLMVIAVVVGFCAQMSGMEIEVTLGVSKKMKEGHRALLSKPLGSQKVTRAAFLTLCDIDREKKKSLFKDLFKKKYKYLVAIDKAMYKQDNLEKDWLERAPTKVLLKFILKNIERGKNDADWKNDLTFPQCLPYGLVKSLMRKPFVYECDDYFKVILTLDADSQQRFKQEKDISWQEKLRSAFVPLAVLTAAGIGLWAYKNQPNSLSDFFSAGYAKIIVPIMRYLKWQ